MNMTCWLFDDLGAQGITEDFRIIHEIVPEKIAKSDNVWDRTLHMLTPKALITDLSWQLDITTGLTPVRNTVNVCLQKVSTNGPWPWTTLQNASNILKAFRNNLTMDKESRHLTFKEVRRWMFSIHQSSRQVKCLLSVGVWTIFYKSNHFW